jgi:LysR family transcriptional regulator, cyn operon transcriptional activator
MEHRHLRYFLAVAQTQHMTQAAERVHVTQSTLSHQISQLEELLGVALFDRVGRGIRLTQAGELFRGFAQRALKEMEDARVALDELENVVRGSLRLGVIHTYNSTLVPPIVAQILTRHPGVKISVEDLPAIAIEEAIAEGELDLGIAFAPAGRDIAAEPIFEEELVLIVNKKHPLAQRRAIKSRALSEIPLALQSHRFATRRLIDQAFGAAIADNVRVEMSSIESLLNTVRTGLVGTIVSERAFGDDSELSKVRITHPTTIRTAALLWHRGRYRTPAAREFAALFRDAYQKIGARERTANVV